MSTSQINILLTSFPGLGLLRTLSFQTSRGSTIADINDIIVERLPTTAAEAPLILTTNTNRKLVINANLELFMLLEQGCSLLPLRLSAPLVGGKDFPEGT